MSNDKFISLDSLKEYNKQMKETYIKPIEEKVLPVVDETYNNQILQVVNGAWTATKPTVIYIGTAEPTNETGEDGDLYLQTD
jgi:hypothetical protein